MPNEIGVLFVGFVGGGLGAAFIFLGMYIHFHLKFRNYFYNKEHFKTRMKVLSLNDELSSLKIQVARLNAEAYHAVIEDAYK